MTRQLMQPIISTTTENSFVRLFNKTHHREEYSVANTKLKFSSQKCDGLKSSKVETMSTICSKRGGKSADTFNDTFMLARP